MISFIIEIRVIVKFDKILCISEDHSTIRFSLLNRYLLDYCLEHGKIYLLKKTIAKKRPSEVLEETKHTKKRRKKLIEILH